MKHILTNSLETIRGLSAGEAAWCWMGLDEARDRAAIIAISCADDPSGTTFAAAVRKQHTRASDAHSAGLIRRLPSGGLVFVVRGAVRRAARIHAVLCRGAVTAGMPDLTVVRMRGDDIVKTAVAVNLAAQAGRLASLAAGERCVFYLMDGPELAAPRLLVADENDALRELVAAERQRLQRRGRKIRGELRRSSRGHIEFRAAGARPADLDAVARWADIHRASWPALAAAVDGARLSITDADGAVVARHHHAA